MKTPESKSFLRQGSWMIAATVGGGAFMTLVHPVVTARLAPEEYGLFFTLLRCLELLSFPVAGVQAVFAQQAAAAVDEARARQLAGAARALLKLVLLLWAAMAGAVFLLQAPIRDTLKIANPTALWVTLAVALCSLLLPVLRGLLQGRQQFIGLGSTMVLDGAGRLAAVCVAVLLLGGLTAGAMAGAFAGQAAALLAGLWLTRDLWRGPASPFEWRPWLRRLAPFTLGAAALMFLSAADAVFVRSVFPEAAASRYAAAFMIGFALLQFTTPLAVVMFPKVSRSAARGEQTDALRTALLGTALLGGLAALAATLLPWLPLRILYFRKPELWDAAPLVAWFVWSRLLFTLANVLIGNLLARERFAIIPWLVAAAAGLGLSLAGLKNHLLTLEPFAAFRLVAAVLGGFNLLLLLAAAWLTWGGGRRTVTTSSAPAP